MSLPILPTISTFFIVLSAIFVGFGWYNIVRGKQQIHIKFMISASISALTFFLIYVSRTLFQGNTSFGGPDYLEFPFHIFLISHIILATFGGVLGLMTLWFAYKKVFFKHKKVGRTAAIVWLCTAPTGVAVFILLYVMYPGGQTKPVWEILFRM
jgi:putative membrane protein